jgi:hypothetical protein
MMLDANINNKIFKWKDLKTRRKDLTQQWNLTQTLLLFLLIDKNSFNSSFIYDIVAHSLHKYRDYVNKKNDQDERRKK